MMLSGVSVKIKQPARECNDEECPYHGHLKVRGKIRIGRVVSLKAKRMAVVEVESFYYVKKYMRYERRRSKLHARVPACVDVSEGDRVAVGETRPLAKSVAHVVLGRVM